MELVKDGPNRYRLRRTGSMRVDCLVYANEYLIPLVKKDQSLQQLANAASLPGVVGHVYGMPDIHEGFGLPIGGVMATAPNGVISAGAVGMDINCGVRFLTTNIPASKLKITTLRKLLEQIEKYTPTGIGKKRRHEAITKDVFELATCTGARAIIDRGYGWVSDLGSIEEEGCLSGADLGAVSKDAYQRGSVQLGTLGGGNHFIELQVIEEVYDRTIGGYFGLFPGLLAVMIHTGSRGFGHQICTDYSKSLLTAAQKYGIVLPERGLACAPIDSKEGRSYYAAMACAVNFAFANRQLITHDVRRAFGDIFSCDPAKLGLKLVYDVAHNIAKWEKHHRQRILVHRKGAIRALPPGHPENPVAYRQTGHPVLVPGSMGTASYVLVGNENTAESFYSVNHGAGRRLSRTAAIKEISREEFETSMQAVLFNRRNYRDLIDEAPGAYKDIDQVVQTLVDIGLACKVARLRPLAVLKGKD